MLHRQDVVIHREDLVIHAIDEQQSAGWLIDNFVLYEGEIFLCLVHKLL